MKKVLIIEDNIEIRENTAELLELGNYSVITAENGNEGFELAKRFVPDIILCDMMMPETDGRKFLKLARADEELCNIPLIFFSAGSLSPEVQQGLIKESNEYLPKPFTEQELLETIKRALLKKLQRLNVLL